jgi:hypothetical protein
MPTINNIDVLAAIQSYIEKNSRPCPSHYLTDKFGDDVSETILSLKKDSKIQGLRGRNGGVIIAGMVIDRKKNSDSSITATKISVGDHSDSDGDSDFEIVDLPI